MKNLFKKAQLHSASSGDSSSLVTPKKHTLKTNKSPSTPPITPSPTKSEDAVAGLSVQIIPSQKEHSSRPQEPNKSETNDIYNLSKNSDDSTLFAAVLGLGCGSPLWEVSTSDNASSPRRILGSNLTPIPEENIASWESRKHEWGIAPVASFDDEETEESADNHDDFEIVLQQASHGSVLLCQPCEQDSTKGMSTAAGPQQKPKRRFKFPKVKSAKDKKQSEMKEPASTGEGSVVSSSTSTHVSSAQETKRAVTKDRRKVLIGKIFHARFHKNKRRNGGHKDVSTSSIREISDTKVASNETVSKKKSQSKNGKWKCVHDPTSKRIYYYHTITREVTWERPPGFVEWKVARDANDKQFFYNVITKETRWDMPPNFELWREVKDKNTGKNYYYNVLTKETSWEKPAESHRDEVARDDGDQNGIQVLVSDNSKNPEESLDKGGKGTTLIEEVAAVSTIIVQDDKKDADTNKDSVGFKSPITVSTDATCSEDPPRIFKTDNHIRLERLLSTYCPDEKENNAQLLEKCKGQETPIIKALEGIVEDTPFDELRLTIFSFVKTVLREMGEEPFDERKPAHKYIPTAQPRPTAHSQFSIARPSPKRMNRVNTYASSVAGYSFGSRALSHVTGRSATTNMTEQTNRINNTSSRMFNCKGAQILQGVNENYPSLSVENSFEELTDVTDDDIQKNVVLDMKDVKTHFEIPLSKLVKPDSENISEQADEQQNITIINSSNNFAMENNDSMTIESAYAADNDDETDHHGWEEEEDADDVSALSDSFGHTTKKKYTKEKKILSSREEYIKHKKVSTSCVHMVLFDFLCHALTTHPIQYPVRLA
jgi:hypothetical protein